MCGDVRRREILDVGCGTGYFAREMAERGASVTGVDLAPRMIEQGKRTERAAPHTVAYRVMDAANSTPSRRIVRRRDIGVVLQDAPDAAARGSPARPRRRRFVASISHPCTDTPHRGGSRTPRPQPGSKSIATSIAHRSRMTGT